LFDIDIPHDLLSNDSTIDEAVILPVLDGFYRAIVSGLFNASVCSVPRVRHSFYKFWWNEELSLLKDNSIRAHKLWATLGKPRRSGDIFVPCNRLNMSISQLLRLRKSQWRRQLWGTGARAPAPRLLQAYGYVYKLTNYRPNCVYNVKVYLTHIRLRIFLDLLRLSKTG